MDDETLLALMTKIDPMTARVPPGIRQIVDAVIAYEREACAKVCEGKDEGAIDGLNIGKSFAYAIRTRSNYPDNAPR